MFRRLTSPYVAHAAGARTIVQLSESNPVLANNAKHRNFKLNVWVERDDEYWWKEHTQPRSGEATTVIKKPTRVELFNVDQLMTKPDIDENVMGHFSLKTKKRYSNNFGTQLDDWAKKHKLDSKHWLSLAEIKKQNYKLVRGAIPFVTIFEKQSEFFNAEQFTRPEFIQLHAFNGGTGRAYISEAGETLSKHAQSNGYPNAIYFTENQARGLNLSIPQGIVAAEVNYNRDGADEQTLYPVTALENFEFFLKSLQRFSVDKPTYVISGKQLPTELAEKAHEIQNPTNYWVSRREAEGRGHNIIGGSKGISLSYATNVVALYNLHQLNGVEHAISQIGKFIPNSD